MPGPRPKASVLTVFLQFLRLGCTSFGGPIAHLGYFRQQFVHRLRWLEESTFAEVVGLCQALPGPSSSQVGFTIGLLEAGLPGACAAWLGFTLPSAILMFALAEGHALFTGRRASGILHSLQLVAVAVVAQAVFGMVKTLTPDPVRRIIALLALMIVLFFHHPIVQLTAIAIAAGLGLVFCRQHSIAPSNHLAITLPRSTSLLAGVLFLLLLLVPPLLLAVHPIHTMAVFQAFYRSGALVFGGGHVVLPLLQSATVAPGWIDPTTFLAGYGGAQALPGPLFTFAAFLGAALLLSPHGSLGASLALIAIFLPGMLLILTFLPFWTRIRVSPRFQAMLAGINAGVVGLLAAALYRPLWTSSVGSMEDLFFVLAAVLALIVAKLPPWMVVAFAAVLWAITTQLP